VVCSRAPSSPPSRTPSPSPAACPIATSPRLSARRAKSASTASSAQTATAARPRPRPAGRAHPRPCLQTRRRPRALPVTASSSLGEALGLGEVDDDELYAALDWLLARQAAIETALAKRHLQNGTLLYDVSSSHMEGRCCAPAKRPYSRDGKKGTLQTVSACSARPTVCPVALEVLDGNTADPMTLAPQVDELKQRFGLSHVLLVGDRGMITEARITEDIKSAGLTGSLRCVDPPAEQRRPAAHAVRHARHGLHHLARLPGSVATFGVGSRVICERAQFTSQAAT
jgi:hypothetical protein